MKPYITLLKISLILFLLWLASPAAAQSPDLKFDFVFNMGSPASQTLIQDEEGFLWAGTAGGGLFRYDGYELKNYEAGPGMLSNGYVYGIVPDRTKPDILWLGTKGGLNRFDKANDTFTYYQHDPNDPHSLSSNAINDIFQDGTNANTLWIATEDGLNRFDIQTETFVRYLPNPTSPSRDVCPEVWRVIEDRTDPHILWLGTWGCGLGRFDKTTATVSYYTHQPDDPHSLAVADNIISDIAQDRDDPDILWIGTLDSGLEKFNRRTERFTHYPTEAAGLPAGVIGLVYDDGRGRLWLGGYVDNNGLTIFDKERETFTNYKNRSGDPRSLSSDLVVDVYESWAGIFWLATYSGQVDKYDRYTQNFQLYRHIPNSENSLSNSSVTSLYEDRAGDIWLGTQAGLNRLQPETGRITHYTPDPADPNSLAADYIYDTYEDADGNFWVSFWIGPLVRFDRETGRVTARFQPDGLESFTQIIGDPDDPDILWLTTRPLGLARFDRVAETFRFYPANPEQPEKGPTQNFLYEIIHDHQEPVLWIGGWESGGLDRFDKETETFTHYRHDPNDPDSLANDAIGVLHQDRAGNVWIGTLGGGLDKFDKASGTFTHYNREYGLPASITAIVEDDGYLWLSSHEGLIKFNPQTESVEAHYHESDGLQGEAFNNDSSLKARDGRLWFGGTKGANSFYPDQLAENPYVPPIVLTSFTQGGEPLDINPGNITLDWQHNFFEFEFVALNYTQPGENRYKYKLHGLDLAWYDSGTRRFGRYTALPPGQYTLQIIGSNNDGVWNEEGVSLPITVTPAFWQTWWFYLLSGAAVLGIFGFIYQTKANQLRAERAAAAALRESEKRFRLLVENMPVLINAQDEAGRFVFWNRQCEEASGYNSEEIIGNPQALSLLYPDSEYRRQLLDEWARRGNTFMNWEINLNHKDGSRRTIAWSSIADLFPVPGWYSWAIGIDITDRKRLERQLLQAQKMEAVGRLAGGVAHDFNNFLTALIGYAELAKLSLPEDHPANDDIQNLLRVAERTTNLTRQLLVFARRQIVKPQILDLNQLILNMDKMLRRLIGEDIELTTRLSSDLGNIKADPGQIEQMLVNLVINARDAMPQGGKLTIESANRFLDEGYTEQHAEVEPGPYVMFAVSDTGEGMTDEVKANIFEPFFTTKEVGKGTGLGLAICFGIVKQSNGHIWVYSEVDQGTTFRIYLPRVVEPADPLIAPNRSPEVRGGTETILLVEDEAAVRDLAMRTLRRYGYHVLAVPHGVEALRLLELNPEIELDLLLTDVIMPHMSGKELAQRLQTRYPELKVLYASGYTDNTIVHHGVLDPGVALLQKPFAPVDLARRVREVLDA